MTNEIPKEAGWPWACRHSVTVNGLTSTAWCVVGRVTVSRDGNGNVQLKFKGGAVEIREPDFNQFDWHRIDLPEGWSSRPTEDALQSKITSIGLDNIRLIERIAEAEAKLKIAVEALETLAHQWQCDDRYPFEVETVTEALAKIKA